MHIKSNTRIETNLKSKLEFYQELKRNIKYASQTAVNKGSLAVDSFLGGITYEGFWLLKTGPLGSHGLQRYFCGRCVESDGKVEIVGRFQFPRRVVVLAWIAAAIFFLLLSPGFFSSSRTGLAVTFLFPCVPPLLILGFCHIIGSDAEKETLEFLRSLGNDSKEEQSPGIGTAKGTEDGSKPLKKSEN